MDNETFLFDFDDVVFELLVQEIRELKERIKKLEENQKTEYHCHYYHDKQEQYRYPADLPYNTWVTTT